MKFKEFLAEKKITGIKGSFKYDNITGNLKTIIWVQGAPDELEDETTITTSIRFDGKFWSLNNLDVSDVFERTPFKKEVRKAIEKMMDKLDNDFFEADENDDLYVSKYAEFEIILNKNVLK